MHSLGPGEEGLVIGDRAVRLAILIGVLATLIGLPVASALWLTAVLGRSHAGPLPPLTGAEAAMAARMRTDVAAIASAPHNVAHPEALERAAAHIEARLAALGYPVSRQPFRADGRRVRNIEAMIEPARRAAQTLVIGAHYDSAGEAPGANDNGSGAAALLELARSLADLRGRTPTRIRLVFFVNEEPPYFQTGRMGSLVYARRLKSSGEKLAGMISLETLGYYSDAPGSQHYPPPLGLLYPDRGDFVAFVGLTASRPFVRRTVKAFREAAPFPSQGGTAPAFVQGIDWSDHWAFAHLGIPALMVTDTAPFRYPHYHGRGDTPDRLVYPRLARVVAGLDGTIRKLASAQPRD